MKYLRVLLFLNFLFHSDNLFAQIPIEKELDSIRNANYKKLDSVFTLHELVSKQLDTSTYSTERSSLQHQLDSLDAAIRQSWENKLESEFAFVQRHLSSPLSLDVLKSGFYRPEASKYYDLMQSLYFQLPRKLQNSTKGKALLRTITNCNNSAIGKEAPNFTARDIAGNTLVLSDFHNKKYVLLDFWASWCVPCQEEVPLLKQAFTSYKSKGLEIIGVSIDEDPEKWKMAINKDSICEWRHIIVKINEYSIYSLYFILGVPEKILIDKEGTIIARWVGKSRENTEALESMLQGIFQQ